MSSLAQILEHVLKDGIEYPISLAGKKNHLIHLFIVGHPLWYNDLC